MRALPTIAFISLSLFTSAQVTIIGHNRLNEEPLKLTTITIKQGTNTVRSFNTQSKSDFRVDLDFGHDYRIYFQNPRSPAMFMEVAAANVPIDKYEYRMTYELNVPFVSRNDEDIDTAAFSKAFHRVVFNGKSKMVDDTAYNNAFARTVIKTEEPEPPADMRAAATLPSILAGKIFMDGKARMPLLNKSVSILRHDGSVLKTTSSNRSGIFVFTDIHIDEVSGMRMELADAAGGSNPVSLLTNSDKPVASTVPTGGFCEWKLSKSQLFSLVNNQYSSNIGGKLVAASPREKKFFADQTVYLSNRHNTVIKQTRTSKLGTFVFEDIKPDHQYLIGVERAQIPAGAKVDLLNKDDRYIGSLDSLAGSKSSMRLSTGYSQQFNDLSIAEEDMKMDVKGVIYGDNVHNPIGKLKIVLLNDQYQVIDSAVTTDYGTFKFKYLPFLKRFYLSAENSENILDVFKNILIYSSDENLIKIMTHQKGNKFRYDPVPTEMASLRDIEISDPWMQLLQAEPAVTASASSGIAAPRKTIVENILFESASYNISEDSKEILDKVILVLNTNKTLRIEIGAHTDCKGDGASNMKLSHMRATTVKDYITAAGIDRKRIMTRGYGESRPMNNCVDGTPCSEAEHAQNRRIEFRILENQ